MLNCLGRQTLGSIFRQYSLAVVQDGPTKMKIAQKG